MTKEIVDRASVVKFCETAQEGTERMSKAFLALSDVAKAEGTPAQLRYEWGALQRVVGNLDAVLQALEIVLHPGMLEVPEELPKAGDSDKMIVPPFDDDRDDTEALGADTEDDDPLDLAEYDDGADEDLKP